MSGNALSRLFTVYQILAAFVVLPGSFALWLRTLGGRYDLALAIVALPVVFGYVLPGIGTNVLGLWEFKAGIRLGRYTLLHGVMFGGASSALAWLCAEPIAGTGSVAALKAVHATAVTLGFWNWAFDTAAIASGLAVMRNKAHVQGRGAAAVTADYAPLYFAVFGGTYGLAAHLLATIAPGWHDMLFWGLAVGGCAAAMLLPVAAHCLSSFVRHGYWGLRPYTEETR
jgi:hypothetical protein